MKRLRVYQALWGMEGLPGVTLDTGLEHALDRIDATGFDGVGVSLMQAERAAGVARWARERGKSFEAIGFVRVVDDLARQIERAHELGAHHLNVQIMTRVDRVRDAVRLLSELESSAARATIPVFYETHRGRLTNDLLFMVRVLDELPQLKLTGDLSHYVLAHEMPVQVSDADLARMSRVLAQCWAFHGRVASSHQIQVSLNAPQHQRWVQQFQRWWREGFRSWMARASEDAELTFMAELGPPHYAITAHDGAELSDRWQEALQLKDIARQLWAEVQPTA